MDLDRRLKSRRLLVVTGKGGVGKSVITAALGRMLAAAGRRTLVLEVDPRENLHQLLDVAPSGGEVTRVGTQEAGNGELYLQNLKPGAVVDWLIDEKVPIPMLSRRVKTSPVYQRFVEGAPGLREMAIIGHSLRLTRGQVRGAPKIDTVVLDAPATGHGVYLLTAPRLFAETITDGPFHNLAQEGADFVADPDDAGLVIVTLAEEMPVQEALELRQALEERFRREPDLLVVNGLYPPLPNDVAAGATAAGAVDDPLLELWRRRRRVNERELERLEEAWPGPRIELPLLPIDPGPGLVAALRERLESSLERPGGIA